MQNDILLELFLELEARTPEGLRAELIEGEITVSSAPEGDHEHCLSELFGQVVLQSATRMSLSGHKGLTMPGAAGHPPDHVIPDATFAPREQRLFRGAPPWMACDSVAMVAEVTGSRAVLDRIAKRRCYGRAGIPLYLLVDRERRSVTLHSAPSAEGYTERHSVAYGKPLPLPPPFAFDLETADFA
ncbi:Uma2 family endonuclease [Streptomyces rectiverticillatus]|uniref:Uma2 family endonuclease n=1 Tax=Streptomyces rectiverticillatus TaxID=173860 RepID=UPI001FE31F62|nr:Uma2 family endonuclease [Streptomyces rectiverticillatus]